MPDDPAPPPVAWFENDTLFRAELAFGLQWQAAIARRFRTEGLAVIEPVTAFCADAGRYGAFTQDHGDLLVTPRRLVVEVKARRFPFSGPHDFPFAEAFLGAAGPWEKKPRPFAVVLVSSCTGAVAVAPGHARLAARTVPDRRRGIRSRCMVVPAAALVTWDALLRGLRRQATRAPNTQEDPMPYETKDGSGSLFRNRDKTSAQQPDYSGKLRVAGVVYRLAGWKQTSKDGKTTYLSLKVTPDEGRPPGRGTEPGDEELPF